MWCFSSPTDPGAATPAAAPAETPAPAANAAPTADAGAPAGPGAATPAAPTEPPLCGPGVVAPCRCAGAAITSQMVMTEPANRARTRMAVGERVELTYSLGDATWAPADNLSAASGGSVTFTAPDTAGTVTLTATGGGCSASITLTIVEPEAVHMIKRYTSATRVYHVHDTLTLAFTANIFIGPDDVNFHRIQVLEEEVTGQGSGAFAANGGMGHGPKPGGSPCTTHVQAGMGTFVSEFDTVGASNPAPWTAPQTGAISYNIPWRWRVGSSGPFRHPWVTVRQRVNIEATGQIHGRKAGAHASAQYGDPTSPWSVQTC